MRERVFLLVIVMVWAVGTATAQTATPTPSVIREGLYEFETASTFDFVRSGVWTTEALGGTGAVSLFNRQASGDRAIRFTVEGSWMVIWWAKNIGGSMEVCLDGVCTLYPGNALPTDPFLQQQYVQITDGYAYVEIKKSTTAAGSFALDRVEVYQGHVLAGASMPTPTPITIYPTPTEITFPATATPWTPVPIATYTPTPWSRAVAQLVNVSQVEVIGPGTYADNTSPQVSYDGTWTNLNETMAYWQTLSTSTAGSVGFRMVGQGFSIYDFLGAAYGDLDVCVNGVCSTVSRTGTYGPAKIHVTALDYGVHQVELIAAGDWAFDGVYIHAAYEAEATADPEATPEVDPNNVSEFILVGSTTARLDYTATAGDVASVLMLVGVLITVALLLGVTLWKR